jgi:hypothetical protein
LVGGGVVDVRSRYAMQKHVVLREAGEEDKKKKKEEEEEECCVHLKISGLTLKNRTRQKIQLEAFFSYFMGPTGVSFAQEEQLALVQQLSDCHIILTRGNRNVLTV